jgi:serine/threonine protein kinase
MQYGKWEVIRQLGQGGQGIAYLVNDTDQLKLSELPIQLSNTLPSTMGIGRQEEKVGSTLGALQLIEKYLLRESDRFCAVLKILHEPARQDPKALARLRREVEILGQLDHPSLIKIVDASVDDGWYVTPYYRDGTLADHLRRFQGCPQEALEVFRSLVDGVAQLHAKQVVHRDIKPENIFVSGSRLVLGDFGIVYFEYTDRTRLSDTYENVGSRDWMPGWAMGMQVEEVRPTFDVFSLGKVLWAMVSGRTKMRLWYFDRPEFNLRRQFPDDERMLWINRLLQGSVREHEEDVWDSACDVLDQIDYIRVILRRGGQVMDRDVKRWCYVCGIGQYKLIINEESPEVSLRNFGLNPTGVYFRIFQCRNCGHVQMFRVEG